MKVLLFPSSFSPVLGGLQAVTKSLAHGLRQANIPVHVVTNRYPRSLPAYEKLDQIPVSRTLLLTPKRSYLEQHRPDLFLGAFFYFPQSLWRLNTILREFQPTIVNVHFPDAQISYVARLRQRYKFALVVSLHGDEIERWLEKDKFRTPIESLSQELTRNNSFCDLRKILRQADIVTACSCYLLSKAILIEPSVKQKGRVIYNGLDVPRFHSPTCHSNRPFILAYGRMTSEKGYDLLLEAFARVKGMYPNVELVLGGDGAEFVRLQKQASELALDDCVRFVGRIGVNEIPDLLGKALFVVVPSRRETFGMTALEAMAAGKAVLATNVGGLPEFVDTRWNLLVESNVDALAVGLQAYLGNLEAVQERGRQNKKSAAEFSESAMVERYLQVFQRMDE